MAEGLVTLPYYYDEATGTLQPWEGRDALDGLISTDEVDCAQAAATTIMTITAGFKGYVTMLSMYNSTAAAQTFILRDNAGADIKKTITIPAKDSVTLMSDNAFLVLDAGIVTGQAGTADFIQTTITYFERKV